MRTVAGWLRKNSGQKMRRASLMAAVLTLGISGPIVAGATTLADANERQALTLSDYAHTVLQAITQAGQRLVVVGERGLVLLSDDAGKHWRQAQVPVSVTLTAVQFVSPEQGWATGHFGTVLHTGDGGETWQVQLDGVRAADLTLAEVQARAAQAAPDDLPMLRELRNAQLLVQDGPDKPFMDLHFFDERHGIVIGAYNLILSTDDGGQSWRSIAGAVNNPGARHLYALSQVAGSLYIVGEEGRIYRSDDRGESFFRLEAPYDGSLFTVAGAGDTVVVAGLRGNAYRSADRGLSWRAIALPVPVSVNASLVTAEGELLLANQAGMVLSSQDNGHSVQLLVDKPLPPLTGLLRLNDRGFLATSLQGLIELPASAQSPSQPNSDS